MFVSDCEHQLGVCLSIFLAADAQDWRDSTPLKILPTTLAFYSAFRCPIHDRRAAGGTSRSSVASLSNKLGELGSFGVGVEIRLHQRLDRLEDFLTRPPAWVTAAERARSCRGGIQIPPPACTIPVTIPNDLRFHPDPLLKVAMLLSIEAPKGHRLV